MNLSFNRLPYSFEPPEIGVSHDPLLKLVPHMVEGEQVENRIITIDDLGPNKWFWPVGLSYNDFYNLMFRIQSLRVKCFRVGVDEDGRAEAPEAAWLIPAEAGVTEGRMIWRAGVLPTDAPAAPSLSDSSGLPVASGWAAFRRLANQDHFYLHRGRSEWVAFDYAERMWTPYTFWEPLIDPYTTSPWNAIDLVGANPNAYIDLRFQQDIDDQIDRSYNYFVCDIGKLKWDYDFRLRYRDGAWSSTAKLIIDFSKSVQSEGVFYPYIFALMHPDGHDIPAFSAPAATAHANANGGSGGSGLIGIGTRYNAFGDEPYSYAATPLPEGLGITLNFTTNDPLDNTNDVFVPMFVDSFHPDDWPDDPEYMPTEAWITTLGKISGTPTYTDTDGIECPGFTFDVRLGKFYDYDQAYNTETGMVSAS